jgi:ubiquinone/menaquinone biosynthesis C-methylase UbiE
MKNNYYFDKLADKSRYDNKTLNTKTQLKSSEPGSQSLRSCLRTPYLYFEKLLKKNIKKNYLVLEIGSGDGSYTIAALIKGAKTIATDISEIQLSALLKKRQGFKNLRCLAADMEFLPFADSSFDIVYSAGSLSYGDNNIVALNIYRILKPGGYFICVDSLNSNPIYSLNRYVRYLLKSRSKSSIKRIPSLKTINYYRKTFQETKVQFFGSLTWAVPFFQFLFNEKQLKKFLDITDKYFNVRGSAFKFVLISKKCKSQ